MNKVIYLQNIKPTHTRKPLMEGCLKKKKKKLLHKDSHILIFRYTDKDVKMEQCLINVD